MYGTYNFWLVALSVVVAVFVSHTALNLSSRVSVASHRPARLWLTGGAVAMGCGIWSMHFVGMLAFSLPIPLSYDVGTTLASLAIAIAISGFCARPSRAAPKITLTRRAAGARRRWGSASAPCTTRA